MPSIPCFWLEPQAEERYALRRYASRFGNGEPQHCPGAPNLHNGIDYSYHTARVDLGVRPLTAGNSTSDLTDAWPHDDPRWPRTCDKCPYAFQDSDVWQLWTEQLFRRVDTGERTTLRDAAPGAMWDATWYAPDRPRPDGIHLMVQCPGGTWDVDSAASNGPGWERTGTPPLVTATPSIGIGPSGAFVYHGWLRNGVLEDA